jgi:hypothetical protein
MISAPQFLYLPDRVAGPVPGQPSLQRLDASALAARLAFHYWQTTPDDALLGSAERGELDDPAGLGRVVERMLADPRAERSLRTFVREWFSLDGLHALDALVGDPVFDAFAGENLPSPDLREAMIGDVLDSFTFHAARGDSYADWLQSPFSFARSQELAAIYGTPPWDGQGTPPRFAVGTRAGLLTRAALLASGSANTRPILKGVFVRKLLLCDDLPPPPANANNVPPSLSPLLTTREVVEEITQQPDSSCASCHTYRINPLGFVSEDYDALGRLRKEQRLFSEAGAEVLRKPVDTRVVPRVAAYDETPANNVTELVAMILKSGKGEACFARQYLRFTYGRQEDLRADGCTLEQMRQALRRPNGLRDALRVPGLSAGFRTRALSDATKSGSTR